MINDNRRTQSSEGSRENPSCGSVVLLIRPDSVCDRNALSDGDVDISTASGDPNHRTILNPWDPRNPYDVITSGSIWPSWRIITLSAVVAVWLAVATAQLVIKWDGRPRRTAPADRRQRSRLRRRCVAVSLALAGDRQSLRPPDPQRLSAHGDLFRGPTRCGAGGRARADHDRCRRCRLACWLRRPR